MEGRQADTAATAHNRLCSTFLSGKTRTLTYRQSQLRALQIFVTAHEAEIRAALHTDMRRPEHEVYLYTLLPVHVELRYLLRSLARLMRPTVLSRRLAAPLKSVPTPKGAVLIYAPSNFPIMLALRPLAAAIAAGNCVLLKPSEHAPACEALLLRLQHVLDPDSFAVLTGPVLVAKQLAALPWAHILFTGSPVVGRHVMAAAARHLTPVTLELGGKNPAVVAADADLYTAAASIARSRFANAGQLCLATDYCLVEDAVYDAFITALISAIRDAFTDDVASSSLYGRLTARQFVRVKGLLGKTRGHIAYGGETNEMERYIAPTIVTAELDDVLMADEIFGPILPVIRVGTIGVAVMEISRRPAPLALYVFSRDLELAEAVLQQTQSGSACVNDTVVQIGGHNAFLAGFGESGLGGGHGFDEGFHTFSHRRLVLYSQPAVAQLLHKLLAPRMLESKLVQSSLLAMEGSGVLGRLAAVTGTVGCNAISAISTLTSCCRKRSPDDDGFS